MRPAEQGHRRPEETNKQTNGDANQIDRSIELTQTHWLVDDVEAFDGHAYEQVDAWAADPVHEKAGEDAHGVWEDPVTGVGAGNDGRQFENGADEIEQTQCYGERVLWRWAKVFVREKAE